MSVATTVTTFSISACTRIALNPCAIARDPSMIAENATSGASQRKICSRAGSRYADSASHGARKNSAAAVSEEAIRVIAQVARTTARSPAGSSASRARATKGTTPGTSPSVAVMLRSCVTVCAWT